MSGAPLPSGAESQSQTDEVPSSGEEERVPDKTTPCTALALPEAPVHSSRRGELSGRSGADVRRRSVHRSLRR
uniref:Uncharacterized protein n=1 Tax=Knipowitschia caucasica TaxID=637954 RepID=A0AAV2LD90_KNICA